MISKDEVLKIAKLARLELSEKEIEKMQKDLSSILDYFNLLKEAPKLKTEKIVRRPTSYGLRGATRKDEVIKRPEDLANNLVKHAPGKKDNYIKVKSIL